VFSHILYFCCLGISWEPPVCFGWPCLVTSLWNYHWLLAGFLFLGCSCVLHWVPCYSLFLFCCSLDLGICFLHFPLNPLLIYFEGRMVSIPFSCSHRSTLCCFCPWSMCILISANLQK
jgi:hypothetical protein